MDMLSKGRENWEALDGACAGKAYLVLDRGARPSPWLARLLRAVGADVTLAAAEGDLPNVPHLSRFDAVFVCLHDDSLDGPEDPFSVLAVLGELGYSGRIVAVGTGTTERRGWFVGAGFSAWLGRPLRAPDLLSALQDAPAGTSAALTLAIPPRPVRMRQSKDEAPFGGMVPPAPRRSGLQESHDRFGPGR